MFKQLIEFPAAHDKLEIVSRPFHLRSNDMGMRQASLYIGVLQLATISLSVLASHSTHRQTHFTSWQARQISEMDEQIKQQIISNHKRSHQDHRGYKFSDKTMDEVVKHIEEEVRAL